MYMETIRAVGASSSNFYPFIPEGYEPITRDDPRWVEPPVFISDVGSTTPAFATAVYAPIPNFVAPYQPPVSYPNVPRPEYQPPISVPNESEPPMICMAEGIVRAKNDDIALLQGEVRRLRSQLENYLPPEQSRTTYEQPLIEVGSETRQQPDTSVQESYAALFGRTRQMSKYLI
jgi:hypothetical protein